MTNVYKNHKSSEVDLSELPDQKMKGQNSPSKRLFIIFTCILVMCVAAIPLIKTWIQTHEYKAKFEEAKHQNQQAVEANRQIQAQYQQVNNPEYLEEVARRDYYYSKDGEIIFILPEDAKETAS